MRQSRTYGVPYSFMKGELVFGSFCGWNKDKTLETRSVIESDLMNGLTEF